MFHQDYRCRDIETHIPCIFASLAKCDAVDTKDALLNYDYCG